MPVENTENRILVCFAVREEAGPFLRKSGASACDVLITGIGPDNARRQLHGAFTRRAPALVLTCGFAGGLSPELRCGEVLFHAAKHFTASDRLVAARARPGRFVCSDVIAVTKQSKAALRMESGADAVEMESAAILEICAKRGIPAAIVRSISDAADTDMPIDFNAVFDANWRMSYWKLAAIIARKPTKISELIRFRRETRSAAENLAEVLAKFISG